MRQVVSRKPAARRGKKKKSGSLWIVFLPLLVAAIATPLAVRAASVLALTGPTALRVLYPYVVLAQSQAQRFSPEQLDILSQWILWGQFPFYGLLWVVTGRLVRGPSGPLAALLLHGIGVAAAIVATR